jgi:hypothetical protein
MSQEYKSYKPTSQNVKHVDKILSLCEKEALTRKEIQYLTQLSTRQLKNILLRLVGSYQLRRVNHYTDLRVSAYRTVLKLGDRID